jgi:hypothetical protein
VANSPSRAHPDHIKTHIDLRSQNRIASKKRIAQNIFLRDPLSARGHLRRDHKYAMLEGYVTTRAKTAAKKRAARRRKARPADPFIKALVGATNVEEKAVNRAAQVGLRAIDSFENMSRALLGIPTTPAKAPKRGRLLSWKPATLKTSAALRGKRRAYKRLAA